MIKKWQDFLLEIFIRPWIPITLSSATLFTLSAAFHESPWIKGVASVHYMDDLLWQPVRDCISGIAGFMAGLQPFFAYSFPPLASSRAVLNLFNPFP